MNNMKHKTSEIKFSNQVDSRFFNEINLNGSFITQIEKKRGHHWSNLQSDKNHDIKRNPNHRTSGKSIRNSSESCVIKDLNIIG